MENEEPQADISCLIVRNDIFRELAQAAADLKRADEPKDRRQACIVALRTVVKLLQDVDTDEKLHGPFLTLARGLFDLDRGKRPALFQPNDVIAKSGGKPVGTTGQYAKQVTASALVRLLVQEGGLGVMAARREVADAFAAAGHLTAHKKPMNARTIGDWHRKADLAKLASRTAHLRSKVLEMGWDLRTSVARRKLLNTVAGRLAKPDI